MRKVLIFAVVAALLIFPAVAFADQGTSNDTTGTAGVSVLQGTDQSVAQSVYGSDQVEKLKEEFAQAVQDNKFGQAARILQKLRRLENKDKALAELNQLKEQLISQVNQGDYAGALQTMKKILRLEHKGWAFQQIGRIYKALGRGNRPHVFANGAEVQSDVPPVIENGRTLIPLRAVANALGIGNEAISWNQEDNSVTINNNNTVINLPVDSQVVTVNGKAQRIDVPAVLRGNRVLVPLRFVSQVLGKPVQWYPEGQVVAVGT